MSLSTPRLPVDIVWLVFDQLGDLAFLWSTCRNVSHLWRDLVDAYCRHGVLQNTFIDLYYSDFHTRHGPVNLEIHVPLAFDRFSEDGLKAFFRQRAYVQGNGRSHKGSLRGWLPFIERYCEETLKPKPNVLNKSKPSDAPPLWEQEHSHWRNTLSGDRKDVYLSVIRDMISIGRGDRPPYYIKIYDDMDDTELVDLSIDCKQHEISFNWRDTYLLFFRERDFAARAGKKRVYDEDLTAAALQHFFDHYRHSETTRARRKRMQAWTTKNKHRMSREMRLCTEHQVQSKKVRLLEILNHDNLAEVQPQSEEEEIVPAKLADDHPDLLSWPGSNEDGLFVPTCRKHSQQKCVVL